VVGEPGHFGSPSISPDGGKVAALKNGALLVTDVRRGVTSRLAENVGSQVFWSPDGRQLAFPRRGKVVIANADGAGAETSVASAGGTQIPSGWTPDGRSLLYTELGDQGVRTLWRVQIGSLGSARPLLNTKHDEVNGAVSPDGRWLAYVTDESGRYEVYVQKLEGGLRIQLSNNGGNSPTWRGDGKELFYEARDGSVVSVVAKYGTDGVEFSAPQTLFRLAASYVGGHSYDAARDGQRFVVLAPYRPRPHEPLTVVVNWPALLRK
jgi:Tol biopolymer transport system component